MHPKTNKDNIIEEHRQIDSYQVANEIEIFEEYDVPCYVTVLNIAERVVQIEKSTRRNLRKRRLLKTNTTRKTRTTSQNSEY